MILNCYESLLLWSWQKVIGRYNRTDKGLLVSGSRKLLPVRDAWAWSELSWAGKQAVSLIYVGTGERVMEPNTIPLVLRHVRLNPTTGDGAKTRSSWTKQNLDPTF